MQVEIIGSSTCQPCKMAKAMLDSQGIQYKYYSLGDDPTPDYLPEVRSVPAIFIDKELVGYGVNAAKLVIERL